MKQIIIILGLLVSASQLYAQEILNISEWESAHAQQQKPSIVFLHAEWCKFCRIVEETVLKDSLINKTIEGQYYLVELDGESQNDITFFGQEFKATNTGKPGTHQLAQQLGKVNGKVSYPTLVFLDSEMGILYQHVGTIQKEGLLELLEKLKQL